MWRSRVAGRARTIGNRVGVKSVSRVRIPPSPPKLKPPVKAVFALADFKWKGFEASGSEFCASGTKEP